MTEFRVNRLIWESFEAALEGAGKKFVKELAGTLEVSSDDLVKAIFNRTNKIKVCIHDWNDETALCSTKFQEGSTIVSCTNAKLCGKRCCLECSNRISLEFGTPNYKNLYELEAVNYESEDEEDDRILDKKKIWINDNGIVFNNQTAVGEYNEDTEEITYWN